MHRICQSPHFIRQVEKEEKGERSECDEQGYARRSGTRRQIGQRDKNAEDQEGSEHTDKTREASDCGPGAKACEPDSDVFELPDATVPIVPHPLPLSSQCFEHRSARKSFRELLIKPFGRMGSRVFASTKLIGQSLGVPCKLLKRSLVSLRVVGELSKQFRHIYVHCVDLLLTMVSGVREDLNQRDIQLACVLRDRQYLRIDAWTCLARSRWATVLESRLSINARAVVRSLSMSVR